MANIVRKIITYITPNGSVKNAKGQYKYHCADIPKMIKNLSNNSVSTFAGENDFRIILEDISFQKKTNVKIVNQSIYIFLKK